MAVLTFVHYDSKPSKTSLQKSSSTSIRNLPINSSSALVEALPALEGAAGDNICFQKIVGDGVATVPGAQACRGGLAGTQASIAEKDWFDHDIDSESPSLVRLLSSDCKPEWAEEKPSTESTAGKGNDQALDKSLFGFRGSRAGSTHNAPILLHSDEESEDNNNLNLRHARCVVEGGQSGCDAFDMEYPPMLSTCTTQEHVGSGNGIDKTMSHETIKRRRSNSLPSTSTLGHSTTSLLPREGDQEGTTELVNDSNFEESQAEDNCPKRRKLSTSHGRSMVSHDDLSQPSPPVSDDDEDSEEDDRTLSISLDARPTKSSRSTPASEVTSPIEFEVCPVVTDVDQDWDVREIIGKEDFDGVSYYLVDWHPTLLPEHSLGHAKELVARFEARIRAQRGANNKRGGVGSKSKQTASVQARALSGQQGKKPRGRPRKQI